ncbi:mannose-6-phosphate isomerase, class I [Homoserinibacter sp. GY 40078]|uniref:mannose-6-phosphate isomerase, class I n=1 Tax=Homoserinibacter sp. GY 40078 TaxID=2603275 RepID=UPI0011CCA55E|nr:mannose-6-phosphate isomerase, class I [Homoserinibacter sp. GY 40078]TXK16271.1 mannose-6-phosphate isomerase, class I [Homoserinibacter sp. GY 40078]
MFVEIANTPRDYAWGSTTAIAGLLGTSPSGGPEAELWLGAHPGSPSRVVGDDRTLLDVVEGRLPFLMKVLAADAPLSLQAHPTIAQAEEGFAREEAAGVPVDAPHRNYKDAFHKPEIIYALSDPFRALSGFRPVAETRAVLAPVADDPRIAPLVERLSGDAALQEVFAWLIERGEGVDDLVAAVVEAASTVDGISWQTVRTLAEHYPGDPGIVISLLLHTVELRPGEVLYLPAGNIHAYLEGLGIELMASSDNVLRGGLTPKHVDVPELLSVLDFRPLPAPFLAPSELEPGVSVYRPGVPDFQLTVVSPDAAESGVEVRLGGPAIVLCTSGEVALENGPSIARGGAVYVDGEDWLGVRGRGMLFIASAADA